MTRIKRSIPQTDGGVKVRSHRGPFLTESFERSRPLTIKLYPTFAVVREHGRRKGFQVDYGAMFFLGAKAEARRQQKERLAERKARKLQKAK